MRCIASHTSPTDGRVGAGAISSNAAIVMAFAATCVFVYTSGIKGIAWVAIVKDVAMLVAVGVIGFGLPAMYFGGIGKMFAEVIRQHPTHLTLPGNTATMGVGWAVSTPKMGVVPMPGKRTKTRYEVVDEIRAGITAPCSKSFL